jgi:hypothetical protein
MYKFYIDALIKTAAFYYAITGGILSVVLSQERIRGKAISLALPILMGFGLVWLMCWANKYTVELNEDNCRLAKKLDLKAGFETRPLIYGVRFFAFFYGITTFALGYIAWFYWN